MQKASALQAEASRCPSVRRPSCWAHVDEPPGPDPTTCGAGRSMRVGDDPGRCLRLEIGAPEGTDRSTVDGNRLFRRRSQSAAEVRAPARQRRSAAPRRRPACAASAAAVRAGTGTGRASGSQRCSASRPVNASSASRPSAPRISTVAMSLDLSWTSPSGAGLGLAQLRHDRHQQPGVGQRGQHLRLARRVRGVRRQRRGQRRVGAHRVSSGAPAPASSRSRTESTAHGRAWPVTDEVERSLDLSLVSP